MIPRRTKRALIAVTVTTASLAVTGVVGGGERPHSDRLGARILDRIGSERLVAVSARHGVVEVTARAAPSRGDRSRTEWYASLAAFAYAHKSPVKMMRVALLTSARPLLPGREPVGDNGAPAFARATLSAAQVARGVRVNEHGFGVRVLAINYIRLYGGGAEVVVQPRDPIGFADSACGTASLLLGALSGGEHPYLLTVVDRQRRPVFLLGWNPGGPPRSGGQGSGWQAPGSHSCALLGQPETTDFSPEPSAVAADLFQPTFSLAPGGRHERSFAHGRSGPDSRCGSVSRLHPTAGGEPAAGLWKRKVEVSGFASRTRARAVLQPPGVARLSALVESHFRGKIAVRGFSCRGGSPLSFASPAPTGPPGGVTGPPSPSRVVWLEGGPYETDLWPSIPHPGRYKLVASLLGSIVIRARR